eukprot:Rmarinus@m.18948
MDRKPACKYGKDCRRKNVDHLKEYWHPPKTDAASLARQETVPMAQHGESSKVRDNQIGGSQQHISRVDTVPIQPKTPQRPACMYGAECYQQNELHRRQYSHPPRKPTTTSEVTSSDPQKKARRIIFCAYIQAPGSRNRIFTFQYA